MLKRGERRKIEEIIGKMSCPKAFRCAESGFEILCRARDFSELTATWSVSMVPEKNASLPCLSAKGTSASVR